MDDFGPVGKGGSAIPVYDTQRVYYFLEKRKGVVFIWILEAK